MDRESNPSTVTVVSEDGSEVARGDVLDMSATGAFIGTYGDLPVGPVLRFRITFSDSPAIQELLGRVLWEQDAVGTPGSYTARSNVKWLTAAPTG